jgi:hypothetical protein
MAKKLIRLTVKDLKEAMKGLPNDALVMISSDCEQNNVSPLKAIDTGKIGGTWCFEDPEDNFTEGEDFIGINMKKDKYKDYIILIPSYQDTNIQ